MIRVCPLSALPPGEALRVEAEPSIAVVHTEDGEVFAIDDACTHQLTDGTSLPADVVVVGIGALPNVDEPVAVLGMNQARLFTRWRHQLNAAPVPA